MTDLMKFLRLFTRHRNMLLRHSLHLLHRKLLAAQGVLDLLDLEMNPLTLVEIVSILCALKVSLQSGNLGEMRKRHLRKQKQPTVARQ